LSALTQVEIEDADEEFWRWVFRVNDDSDHPLKISDDGMAQLQVGKLLILAGSFPDDIPKNRLLKIPSGVDYVFVPGENCVYTKADEDGETEKELIDKANNDIAKSEAKILVNDDKQELQRLPGHAFSPLLNIQKCISLAGRSGKGEGESCTKNKAPGETFAAAACDYAIISVNTLKSGYTIKIEGKGRVRPDTPNMVPGKINVTYKVQ
jgi:hypothetical protein